MKLGELLLVVVLAVATWLKASITKTQEYLPIISSTHNIDRPYRIKKLSSNSPNIANSQAEIRTSTTRFQMHPSI